MSDDANMKFMEMLLKNGTHIGNFIMDNHGTMNVHAHEDKSKDETVNEINNSVCKRSTI